MRIQWLGHSCFLITSANGTKVVTDPFDSAVGYATPLPEADIVTISHGHHDHNCEEAVPGQHLRLDVSGTFEYKDVAIKGINTFHDHEEGRKRGKNVIYCFETDGIRICHCGDLGHIPVEEQMKEIGRADILLIPVGSVYTINGMEAAEIVRKINPVITIPMHYRTPALRFSLEDESKFLEAVKSVKAVRMHALEVTLESLPNFGGVILLDYN